MAIRLVVADYCKDCMGFEASVKKSECVYYTSNGADYIQTNTIVSCKDANRCEALARYLRKELKKMNELKDFHSGDEVWIKATVSSDFDQKFYKLVRCVTAENGEVVWCNPTELIKIKED